MGLAVYNSVILGIQFPQVCYRKLLSPPVMSTFDASAPIGAVPATLDDLKQIKPDTTRGLANLLEYEGNVEEDFAIYFQVDTEQDGDLKTLDLVENGSQMPVTNANRKEYVQKYVDWLINVGIFEQFRAFYLGFHSVCASNALLMLRAEEIELLVCGSTNVDLLPLKRITVYDGYCSEDVTIKYFWDLVLKLPLRHQRRLLLFVTGSDRVPGDGVSSMNFKISKMISSNINSTDMLPMAHTCFNQLILPDYRNRVLLREKLAIALANAQGFGLE